jgi:hypothetical protein
MQAMLDDSPESNESWQDKARESLPRPVRWRQGATLQRWPMSTRLNWQRSAASWTPENGAAWMPRYPS